MSDRDLLETGTRLRRLFLSCFAAIVVGTITYMIFEKVIAPDSSTKLGDWRYGSYRALWYFVGIGTCVSFVVTNYLLTRRDDRLWSEPAKATLHRD